MPQHLRRVRTLFRAQLSGKTFGAARTQPETYESCPVIHSVMHIHIKYMCARGNGLDDLPQAEIFSTGGGMRRRDDYKALNHLLVHMWNSPSNFSAPAEKNLKAEASNS